MWPGFVFLECEKTDCVFVFLRYNSKCLFVLFRFLAFVFPCFFASFLYVSCCVVSLFLFVCVSVCAVLPQWFLRRLAKSCSDKNSDHPLALSPKMHPKNNNLYDLNIKKKTRDPLLPKLRR